MENNTGIDCLTPLKGSLVARLFWVHSDTGSNPVLPITSTMGSLEVDSLRSILIGHNLKVLHTILFLDVLGGWSCIQVDSLILARCIGWSCILYSMYWG